MKINKIITISKITFKESIRDRVLYIFLVFGIAIILISLLAGSISLDQDRKIIIDFSLSGIAIFGLLISIFTGANLLHKDIDKKTIYFLFSKPLNTYELVIGKFVGLGSVLFIIYCIFFIIALIFMRLKLNSWEWIIFEPIFLNYFENLIIINLVMLFSSFTAPIASSVYTFLLYLIGHSTILLNGIIKQTENFILKNIYLFFYYALPNLEKFNIRNDIVFGSGLTLIHTLYVLGYGLIYIIIGIVLTSTVLQKREY